MSLKMNVTVTLLATFVSCFAKADYCHLGLLENVTGALERATHKNCESIVAEDLLKITELTIENEPSPGSLVGLTNLKKLTISAWVNCGHWISKNLFEGVPHLETFVFEGNIPTASVEIYSDAFSGLTSLKKIQFLTGSPRDDLSVGGTIAANAFRGIPNLLTVDFQSECGSDESFRNYRWFVDKNALSGVEANKIHIDRRCMHLLN